MPTGSSTPAPSLGDEGATSGVQSEPKDPTTLEKPRQPTPEGTAVEGKVFRVPSKDVAPTYYFFPKDNIKRHDSFPNPQDLADRRSRDMLWEIQGSPLFEAQSARTGGEVTQLDSVSVVRTKDSMGNKYKLLAPQQTEQSAVVIENPEEIAQAHRSDIDPNQSRESLHIQEQQTEPTVIGMSRAIKSDPVVMTGAVASDDGTFPWHNEQGLTSDEPKKKKMKWQWKFWQGRKPLQVAATSQNLSQGKQRMGSRTPSLEDSERGYSIDPRKSGFDGDDHIHTLGGSSRKDTGDDGALRKNPLLRKIPSSPVAAKAVRRARQDKQTLSEGPLRRAAFHTVTAESGVVDREIYKFFQNRFDMADGRVTVAGYQDLAQESISGQRVAYEHFITYATSPGKISAVVTDADGVRVGKVHFIEPGTPEKPAPGDYAAVSRRLKQPNPEGFRYQWSHGDEGYLTVTPYNGDQDESPERVRVAHLPYNAEERVRSGLDKRSGTLGHPETIEPAPNAERVGYGWNDDDTVTLLRRNMLGKAREEYDSLFGDATSGLFRRVTQGDGRVIAYPYALGDDGRSATLVKQQFAPTGAPIGPSAPPKYELSPRVSDPAAKNVINVIDVQIRKEFTDARKRAEGIRTRDRHREARARRGSKLGPWRTVENPPGGRDERRRFEHDDSSSQDAGFDRHQVARGGSSSFAPGQSHASPYPTRIEYDREEIDVGRAEPFDAYGYPSVNRPAAPASSGGRDGAGVAGAGSSSVAQRQSTASPSPYPPLGEDDPLVKSAGSKWQSDGPEPDRRFWYVNPSAVRRTQPPVAEGSRGKPPELQEPYWQHLSHLTPKNREASSDIYDLTADSPAKPNPYAKPPKKKPAARSLRNIVGSVTRSCKEKLRIRRSAKNPAVASEGPRPEQIRVEQANHRSTELGNEGVVSPQVASSAVGTDGAVYFMVKDGAVGDVLYLPGKALGRDDTFNDKDQKLKIVEHQTASLLVDKKSLWQEGPNGQQCVLVRRDGEGNMKLRDGSASRAEAGGKPLTPLRKSTSKPANVGEETGITPPPSTPGDRELKHHSSTGTMIKWAR